MMALIPIGLASAFASAAGYSRRSRVRPAGQPVSDLSSPQPNGAFRGRLASAAHQSIAGGVVSDLLCMPHSVLPGPLQQPALRPSSIYWGNGAFQTACGHGDTQRCLTSTTARMGRPQSSYLAPSARRRQPSGAWLPPRCDGHCGLERLQANE